MSSRNHTSKQNQTKNQIIDAGMYASYMLGLNEPSEAMQPVLPGLDNYAMARYAKKKSLEHRLPDQPVIYFIQEKSKRGFIKIGYSSRPASRVRGISVSNPYGIRLLGYMFGNRELEAAIHAEFYYAHFRGEWFLPHQDIFEYIRENCKS